MSKTNRSFRTGRSKAERRTKCVRQFCFKPFQTSSSSGQVISGDFILSIAIFLFILAIIIPLFNRMSSDFQEQQFLEDVQTRLFFVSDSLLKTSGSPNDWNVTNVKSIGLADNDGRINKTKIRRLLSINSSTARRLLGLEGYEFNLSFHVSGYPLMTGVAVSPAAYFYVNDNGLFPGINGSGLVWDLYYAGSSQPQPNNARNVYTGGKAVLFNQIVGNSTLYKTIIIENPELTQAQVNINALKNFVSTGGIIIFEGDAQLISSEFSMSSATDPERNGVVRDSDFVNAPYGANVTFNSSVWYFYSGPGDSQLRIIAEHEATSGAAFIGSWNHGIGKIYYVTDIEGTVNGQEFSKAANLVGRKAEFSTASMQNAITTSRPVAINTDLNSLSKMTMVIGK